MKLIDEKEFVALPIDKRRYFLARLYLSKDTAPNKLGYKQRLFSVIAYLKKQDNNSLSVLYSYLINNSHDGKMVWDLMPLAVLYDQRRRRKVYQESKKLEDFSLKMLEDL